MITVFPSHDEILVRTYYLNELHYTNIILVTTICLLRTCLLDLDGFTNCELKPGYFSKPFQGCYALQAL